MPLAISHPSTSCANSSFFNSNRDNIMDRKIFGSLKSKLTRKNSKDSKMEPKTTTSIPTRNSNLYMTTPTRRPDAQNALSVPTNEPPPAYTPAGPTVVAAANDNDPYAFLSTFDTIIVVDDSGSMIGRSWRETGKALEAITPICAAHDEDGIDLYFLNAPDSEWYQNIKTASRVTEIFSAVQPRGQTPLGTKLNRIMRPYLQRYEKSPETTKPINVIIITDGEPSDDPESVIVYAARKLNKLDAPPWQVGIQFFQVGREPGAREYLLHLDNDLEDEKCDGRDMVDTQPWTNEENYELNGDGILKAVLGSVNKRLDNKKLGQLYHA